MSGSGVLVEQLQTVVDASITGGVRDGSSPSSPSSPSTPSYPREESHNPKGGKLHVNMDPPAGSTIPRPFFNMDRSDGEKIARIVERSRDDDEYAGTCTHSPRSSDPLRDRLMATLLENSSPQWSSDLNNKSSIYMEPYLTKYIMKTKDQRTVHFSQPLSSNASTDGYDPERDGSHRNQTDGRGEEEEESDRISHSNPKSRALKSTSPSLRPLDSRNGSKQSSLKENFEPSENHNLAPSDKMGLGLKSFMTPAQKAEFDFIMARRQNFAESRKLGIENAGSRFGVGLDSSSARARSNEYLGGPGERKIEEVSLECSRTFGIIEDDELGPEESFCLYPEERLGIWWEWDFTADPDQCALILRRGGKKKKKHGGGRSEARSSSTDVDDDDYGDDDDGDDDSSEGERYEEVLYE